MFTLLTGTEDLDRRIGQEAALQRLQQLLDHQRARVEDAGGEVVDVVGPELLMVFPRADAAVGCACTIQSDLHANPDLMTPGVSLVVGIHHGTVNRRGKDVYGDAVNTAARVKSESTARRIVLSSEVLAELDDARAARTVPFDRIEVKGKARPLTLHEMIWEQTDLNRTTTMDSVLDSTGVRELSVKSLKLFAGSTEHGFGADQLPVTLGRGAQCDLPVEAPSASRLHCRIEYRRGKFILVDVSTNGTYLERSDGSVSLLRREEAVLTGGGSFALGAEVDPSSPGTLRFECS